MPKRKRRAGIIVKRKVWKNEKKPVCRLLRHAADVAWGIFYLPPSKLVKKVVKFICENLQTVGRGAVCEAFVAESFRCGTLWVNRNIWLSAGHFISLNITLLDLISAQTLWFRLNSNLRMASLWIQS